MPTEIEAKFLNVNHDDIRAKLREAGATLKHPMRLMRRDMFDHADDRFQKAHLAEKLRIRDEGDKITITYKRAKADSNYVYEVETTVGSYDDMKQLLQAIGLKTFTYQESRRETWHFDNVEVVLDEWPWASPYIEIEGPSEKAIQSAAARLGFDWEDARFGSPDTVYRAQYPGMTESDSVFSLPEVRFDMPVPQYLQEKV